MSRLRLVLELDVDDERLHAFADHPAAPPADPTSWKASDLLAADGAGIVELAQANVLEAEGTF